MSSGVYSIPSSIFALLKVVRDQIKTTAPSQKGEVFGLVNDVIEILQGAFDVVHFFLEEGEVGHGVVVLVIVGFDVDRYSVLEDGLYTKTPSTPRYS